MNVFDFLKLKKDKIGLPILALSWISFFWGTTWLASKTGVENMPALQLGAVRQFISAVIFISFFLFKKTIWPNKKQWKTIVILSFLNFVLSNGLALWGLKYISSGLGAIIGTLFPIWLVLINFFKGSRISKLALKGMILSFIGICNIFYDYLFDFLNPNFRIGILVSLIATITWSFGAIYTKEKAESFNPYFSLGLQMLISSIVLYTINVFFGHNVGIIEIPFNAWIAIAYLVVFGSLTTFVAYLYALQNLPTELSSIYVYINPIVALIIGAFYNNEPLTFMVVFGGIITLSGLYIVNLSIRIKKK